jgi:hypothetical protein
VCCLMCVPFAKKGCVLSAAVSLLLSLSMRHGCAGITSSAKMRNSMRTIIAGGRKYALTAADWRFLDTLQITVVVSGKCSGADAGGEQWAAHHKIPIDFYPADWTKHGRSAGPIRNKEMAKNAHAVVLFPGGDGTKSMHKIAKERGLIIYDRRKIA